jgi:hypothetical protein
MHRQTRSTTSRGLAEMEFVGREPLTLSCTLPPHGSFVLCQRMVSCATSYWKSFGLHPSSNTTIQSAMATFKEQRDLDWFTLAWKRSVLPIDVLASPSQAPTLKHLKSAMKLRLLYYSLQQTKLD